MPKRLRRALDRLSRRKTREEALSPSDGNATLPSLLALPAEIRNQIYEELALDTTLILTPFKDRKQPVISLLLVCKQLYREYKKLLLSNAQIAISITLYNFSNLVRVLEKLDEDDISALKVNRSLWILLHISHVPSRDDRRNLRGWCDYRDSESSQPYFGPGRRAGHELVFEYDVRFLNNIRPPRPMCRYSNGYQMKLDLLRSHLRMYQRLQTPADIDCPNAELKRLKSNIDDCVKLYEELQSQRSEPPLRSMSQQTMESISTVRTTSTIDTLQGAR